MYLVYGPEYRASVGYLGTIEMSKQISLSIKLQIVPSCIRKLRREKRQPLTVLMIILPDSLHLQAINGTVLATYASSTLSYVSSSSENNDEQDNEAPTLSSSITSHITISNSCHVFVVVDTRLCEHQLHLKRAQDFHIECTKDLISGLCLEFPSNSEYVVNLIRGMYTPATQRCNHCEMSSTTSNSDSGIGFHNDCRNISDRIVIVDFPQVDYLPIRSMAMHSSRPTGIFQRLSLEQPSPPVVSTENKRLSVRALADAVSNIITSINGFMTTSLCDDVLSLLENDETIAPSYTNHQHVSVDDIPLNNVSLNGEERKLFLHPSSIERDSSYILSENLSSNKTRPTKQVPDKLSPQVYDLEIGFLNDNILNNDLVDKQRKPISDNGKSEKELNENSRVSSWVTSFANLLEDSLGVKTFAEFMRLGYSAENIYFWTACDRIRHIDNEAERIVQAKIIFSKHLSDIATEPVNVDSQARNAVEKRVRQSADVEVFVIAQKQIFRRMKYDNYLRFIRSDLFKKALQAQERGECLPIEKDNLDEVLKTIFTSDASTNLKKSASNAEDRRRKSLLPSHSKMRRK
ncbi:hypothetical protein GQX74_015134 [Glossina fuscipes]|nr:hypothetical protein GQX74_015134 [Glossina fuscipes]